MSDTHPYHHGDLRSALVQAGLQLARRGGVGALGLRELTRSVGVVPNAAYRHFANRQALVLAVAAEAQNLLADAMLDQMEAVGRDAAPATRALQRLRGVGLGYIRFALAEPGWFELAVLSSDETSQAAAPARDQERTAPPYRLLVEALDGLVEHGLMTRQARTHAEWACWSAVHGFAVLATHGPLRGEDPMRIDELAVHVVDTIVDGVRAEPAGGQPMVNGLRFAAPGRPPAGA